MSQLCCGSTWAVPHILHPGSSVGLAAVASSSSSGSSSSCSTRSSGCGSSGRRSSSRPFLVAAAQWAPRSEQLQGAWLQKRSSRCVNVSRCSSVNTSVGEEAAAKSAPAAAAAAAKAAAQDVRSRISTAATTGALDLSHCGLTEIPADVWRMEGLTDLALAGNLISELPPEIGHLKGLRRLGLAGNLLRALPSEVCQLASLEGLWLHGNLLSELPADVGKLTKLRMLAAAGNQLAQLPPSLCYIPYLQVLSVAGNQLSALPEGWAGLESLKTLALYGNQLASLPDDIWQLPNLQDLWLQGNRLRALPEGMQALRAVKQLSLADNLLERVPESLVKMRALDTLWLYGNRLTELPAGMGKCRKLRNLWLEHWAGGAGAGGGGGAVAGGRLLAAEPSERLGFRGAAEAAHVPEDAAATGAGESALTVGRIAGTSQAALSGGYFKVQEYKGAGERAKVVVVAFGSAPGVPNWGGLLRKIRAAMEADGTPAAFDTLFVVDPARSWFTHGPRGHSEAAPLGASTAGDKSEGPAEAAAAHDTLPGGGAVGGEEGGSLGAYYREELSAAVGSYERVVMLGDSMGASASLLFSPLAHTVIAFCPQVDLSRAAIKPGKDQQWLAAYHEQLVAAVAGSRARVAVHCGSWSHDIDQARLLSPLQQVNVVMHPVNDHRLALELDNDGKLVPLVREEIELHLKSL
eukprot:jgi/Mesen1/5903/ME000003S06934